MAPWSNGRLLVWDATCVDTSHLSIAASEVCAAANQAEQTKIKKYSYLTSHVYHSFTPVAFELLACHSYTWVTTLQTPQVTKAL